MFVRLLAAAGLVCGLLFSAEQQPSTGGFPALPLSPEPANSLPAPLSSAIKKMVTGKWPEQQFMIRLDAPAPVIMAARQCSIPLKEYKAPGDVQFFIQHMPVPKDAAEAARMPVMHAPVCGEPSSPDAH